MDASFFADLFIQYATQIPSTFESALSLVAAVLATFFIISLLVLICALVHHQVEGKPDAEVNLYLEQPDLCAESHAMRPTGLHGGASPPLNAPESAHAAARYANGGHRVRTLPACRACGAYSQRSTAPLIGQPVLLDLIARLVRNTCPLSRAREIGKCGLCSQETGADCVIRTLPCGHSFHNLCVLRWLVLLRRMRCPDCNEPVTQ